MTWSILAHDPATGAFAVAVTTCNLAVGAAVPHLRAGVNPRLVAVSSFVAHLHRHDAHNFPATAAGAATRDPALVRAELIAQIDAAYDAGIDVTHLDTHMLVMAFPSLLPVYLELGERCNLPIVLTGDATRFLPPEDDLSHPFRTRDQRGIPPIGQFLHTPFGNLSPTPETYANILDQAQPGLTFCAFHFTAPGDADWMSDDASTRLAEYRIFATGRANDVSRSAASASPACARSATLCGPPDSRLALGPFAAYQATNGRRRA